MSRSVARKSLTFAIVSLALAGATHCSLVLGELPDPIEQVTAAGATSRAGASGAATSAGRGGALAGGASGARATGGATAYAGRSASGGSPVTGGEAGFAEDGGESGTVTGGAGGAGGGSGGTAASGGAVMTGGEGGVTSSGGSGAAAGAGGGGGIGATGGRAGTSGAAGTNGGNDNGGTSAGQGGSGQNGGSGGTPPPDCDQDHDGHDSSTRAGCHGDDCDDDDADVHPGQTGYFSAKSSAGDYDYDCNGEEEPLIATSIDCAALLGACSGEGYDGAVPACGKTGAWVRCEATIAPLPALCDAVDDGTKPQACR